MLYTKYNPIYLRRCVHINVATSRNESWQKRFNSNTFLIIVPADDRVYSRLVSQLRENNGRRFDVRRQHVLFQLRVYYLLSVSGSITSGSATRTKSCELQSHGIPCLFVDAEAQWILEDPREILASLPLLLSQPWLRELRPNSLLLPLCAPWFDDSLWLGSLVSRVIGMKWISEWLK